MSQPTDDQYEPVLEWPDETTHFQIEEPVQHKAFAVRYDRKFNLGRFESLHVAVVIWVRTRVPDGITFNLHDARRRVREMARQNVRAQLYYLKEKPEEVFLGLMPAAEGGLDPIYISTVSVSLEQKVNLGNYESCAPAYTDWADMRYASDSPTQLHLGLKRLWLSLWTNLTDEINRVRGGDTDPMAFFGLPTLEVEDLTAESAMDSETEMNHE